MIFDVDGVIADTEPYNARASIAMFEELFGVKGVKRADFDAGLGRGAEAYVRAAATVHGFAMTEEQVAQAVLRRQENFLKILAREPLAAFPGVLELMKAGLARKDFRLAIATSSTREISEPTLKSAGVPYEKMAYVPGSEIKNRKPAPDLFLTAARRLDLEPTRCVVFEDAPDGVQAAKAAGCKCIAVTNSAPAEKLTPADRVVNSLEDVSIDEAIRWIDEA